MTAGGWQGLLGGLLDAAPPGDDTFDLALLSAQDANGTLLKNLLPREALSGWRATIWTDGGPTCRPRRARCGRRHGWSVLRAHPATMAVQFARI